MWKAPKLNELSIFSDRNPLWSELSYYELNEIMRQKGDKKSMMALNNIAANVMKYKDANLLRKTNTTARRFT